MIQTASTPKENNTLTVFDEVTVKPKDTLDLLEQSLRIRLLHGYNEERREHLSIDEIRAVSAFIFGESLAPSVLASLLKGKGWATENGKEWTHQDYIEDHFKGCLDMHEAVA